MLSFLCKRLLPKWRAVADSANTRLDFIQTKTLCIKPFSSSSENIKSALVEDKLERSFTVSFLINSCGLPLERAISASKNVHFGTSERPDSVLIFLRDHGFNNTQITQLVSACPNLLLADPEKNFLPKLDYFHSIGISSIDIANILSSIPSIFCYSLENRLVPLYNFLKSLPLDDKNLVKAMKRLLRIFNCNAQHLFPPNISALRELGVPESIVLQMVKHYPSILGQNRDRFDKIVEEVIEMGYNPEKAVFALAMNVFSSTTKLTREHKMEVYRRWGWSEDDVRLLFKTHPFSITLSDDRIMSTMDFLVNKMGCQLAAIAKNPSVLCFSLEKRIIPRCSVIKVLQLKGLIKSGLSLATFLQLNEKHFQDKFVTKYQEDVPQLLNLYRGKMSLQELGFGFEEICGMKPL